MSIRPGRTWVKSLCSAPQGLAEASKGWKLPKRARFHHRIFAVEFDDEACPNA